MLRQKTRPSSWIFSLRRHFLCFLSIFCVVYSFMGRGGFFCRAYTWRSKFWRNSESCGSILVASMKIPMSLRNHIDYLLKAGNISTNHTESLLLKHTAEASFTKLFPRLSSYRHSTENSVRKTGLLAFFSSSYHSDCTSLKIHAPKDIIFPLNRSVGLNFPTKRGGAFTRKLTNVRAGGANEMEVASQLSPSGGIRGFTFDNSCLSSLPVDSSEIEGSRIVPNACFSIVDPTPVKNPVLVASSADALSLLGMTPEEAKSDDALLFFSGNAVFPGSSPAAHCYCGHQFGQFAGQLGDGAAIYLGEVINLLNNERWEVQLKGAGKTPFSRSGDGRKVLRSSIREFLCCEHMHALGIPTTRSGTLITSDSWVPRDIFYNGNVKMERCSIVSRISRSFIRFGSFEIFRGTNPITSAKGPSFGRTDILVNLANFIIQGHYPDILEKHGIQRGDTHTPQRNGIEWSMDSLKERFPADVYMDFYKEVIRRTASLVAQWQCIGWCHGVLNTDNMSIIGDTIDYGPFGFVEHFDFEFVPNTSDDQGFYSYKNQPERCRYNCELLGEALAPLLPPGVQEGILETYDSAFKDTWLTLMRKKLGLLHNLAEDEELINRLLKTMSDSGADWTVTFRSLSKVSMSSSSSESSVCDDTAKFLDFDIRCRSAVSAIFKGLANSKEMNELNKRTMDDQQIYLFKQVMEQQPHLLEIFDIKPSFIEAMEARRKASLKWSKTSDEEKFLEDSSTWKKWFDDYLARLELEETQCLAAKSHVSSSSDRIEFDENRKNLMNSVNPKVVLRNRIAQKAIVQAEKGDFSELHRILEVLKNPYDETHDPEDTHPVSREKDPDLNVMAVS